MSELFYVDQAIDAAATDTASLAATIPEVWGARVLEYMSEQFVFAGIPGVMNRELVGQPGDILHLPKFDQDLTDAAATAENADASVFEITTTDITFTPTEYTSGVEITEKSMSRSTVAIMEEASRRLAESHSSAVEKAIVTELEATVNAGTNSGQLLDKTGSQFSEDFVAEARRLFKENAKSYFGGQLVMVIPPKFMQVLEKSTQFTDASIYGGREAILNGEIGRYLGVRILVSNFIRQGGADFDSDSTNDLDAWVLGPDAFRVAWKRDPYIRTDYNVKGRFHEIVATSEWAVGEYRVEHIVRIVADVPA